MKKAILLALAALILSATLSYVLVVGFDVYNSWCPAAGGIMVKQAMGGAVCIKAQVISK